jgi:hypothetical protein
VLLLVIAIFLGIIALRPFHVPLVRAQTGPGGQLELVYQILSQDDPFDPKTQTEGFTLLDVNSGNIWAYPVVGPKAFTNPTLVGTLQQPGAPISRPQ